jgi:exosortase H (IPTLxxWG-CTERM-specific)
MAVNRRKRRPNEKLPVAPSRKMTAQRKTESIISTVKGKWSELRPVLLFLAVFAALMGLFYAFAMLTPLYERHLPHYLDLNARLSGYVLKFLGQDITVTGSSISTPVFSITVKRGCDAIDATALFVCAVLAFPAPFRKKIVGVVAGTLLLVIINLIRIITLFLAGIYFPAAFELMHIDVWQGLFILLAIVFWVFWLLWTGKNQPLRQNHQGVLTTGRP